ncbi:uncharacterized protein AMSG_02654 [Thecamonas trahens ATCC 50062]|uniref:Protein MAK16 homolog n=1 Tax=Thecamonas trahens ATCC 50062 TaxID=461836 RepID=A0A0L0D5I6_THETB|nr:hypothetical protein AMSG_02654 [Thecamonas trahens ATCC 50062]KNC47632.1 hypothetical protein AMSG_02654 [Thecamonas trahens ATCC 50062]|eukprot:XP_013759552.1 hypothetical protein AMSG_02654 [Thecamonas trahens ATCC 50062]
MQSDDLVWKLINNGHCSYKMTARTTKFCRNEYNLTGLCNRASCPLANSKFATVLEEAGTMMLCIKEVERVHTPKDTWLKIPLSKNYAIALKQIDDHLEHWDSFVIHKCKQRLTRLTQVLIRMRKLAVKVQPKLVRVNKKRDRRDARREEKALRAAVVERAIEKELLARLHQNVYPNSEEILNASPSMFNKVLDDTETKPDELDAQLAADEERDMEEASGNAEREREELTVDEKTVVREFIEDLDLDFSFLQDVEDVPYAPAAASSSAKGTTNSTDFFKAVQDAKKKRPADDEANNKRPRKKPARSKAKAAKHRELELERETEPARASRASRRN